jgi:hypothetical protein
VVILPLFIYNFGVLAMLESGLIKCTGGSHKTIFIMNNRRYEVDVEGVHLYPNKENGTTWYLSVWENTELSNTYSVLIPELQIASHDCKEGEAREEAQDIINFHKKINVIGYVLVDEYLKYLRWRDEKAERGVCVGISNYFMG